MTPYLKKQTNYLKYFRPIVKYHQLKHKLNQSEVELLFFLYSEGYFSKKDFDEFQEILPWDKKRFQKLMRRGFIEAHIATKEHRVQNSRKMYAISISGKKLVRSIYNMLEGKEIPEEGRFSAFSAPTKMTFSDKVLRNFIKIINKKRRTLDRVMRLANESED